jgi:hypothetical protein
LKERVTFTFKKREKRKRKTSGAVKSDVYNHVAVIQTVVGLRTQLDKKKENRVEHVRTKRNEVFAKT